MIKRILVISLCVALIAAVFVFPASAAALDYNDYITDIAVNGDQDLITVSFPIDSFVFNLYTANNGALLDSASGSSCLFELPADVPVQLGFGSSFDISLDNIPSDTQFTVVFDTSVQHGFIDETNISYQGWFLYFSSTGGSTWVEVNGYRDSGSLSIQGRLDASYSSFIPFFYFYNFSGNPMDGSSSVNFGLSVSSFQATFSISSLYRLQLETGKTNKILSAVEQKLADQGQTLDDVLGAQQDTNNKLDGIINDKVDPSLPSGGHIVGDLDDAEGQIRDDAQSGLDQGASVQQSAIQVMGQYLSAFACVSWIFDRFSTIPFVSGLLALSFSLGITGAILGIGLSIARSYNGSSRSSRSARSKGG